MRGIVLCEESQTVTKAFRRLGVECFSCDLKPCSGGHPEWHIQGNALQFIHDTSFTFMIGHPPCTHIAVSGTRHFAQKQADGRQQAGIDLFNAFTASTIPHWALENPVSIMSERYRKPDQIIQPYFFGDKAQKTTCLWLNNLPPLYHAKEPDLFTIQATHVDKGKMVTYTSGKKMSKWYANAKKSKDHGTIRSVTFAGIAEAMAVQWTDHLTWKYKL